MNWNSLLVLVLIVLSGLADSLGFVYAAKIWQAERLSWPDVGRSALGCGVGITLNVSALKNMARLGVSSGGMQTSVGFAITIIGVVIFSGRFFSWPRLEQIVATLVLVGLGWLLVRTGE